MARKPKSLRKALAPEWLVAAAFCAYLALQLPYAATDPDEGVYLAAARRMAEGQVPLRDFFVHQMPLLSWLQSLILRLGGSIVHARLLSLVCWSAAGAMLVSIGSRSSAGFLLRLGALCLWFMSPLRAHVTQAVGEPVAILCLVVCLKLLNSRPLFAGAMLALAVLVKPVSLVAAPAVLLCALCHHRRNLPVLLAGMAAASLLTVTPLLWSAPAECLALARTVLDFVGNAHEPPRLFTLLARHGDTDLFIGTIWRTFHSSFFGHLWMIPAGIALSLSVISMVRSRHTSFGDHRLPAWVGPGLLATIFLAFRLAAIPIWSHYLLYYLVPIVWLLAQDNPYRHLSTYARTALVVLAVAALARQFPEPSRDTVYDNARDLRSATSESAKLLSFYPLLDQLSARKSACDFDDPIGVYEYVGIRRDSVPKALHKFIVTDQDLIRCIQSDHSVVVVVNYFYDTLASPEIKKFVATLPADRIYHLRP